MDRRTSYAIVALASLSAGFLLGLGMRERIDPDREIQLQRIIDAQRDRIVELIENGKSNGIDR